MPTKIPWTNNLTEKIVKRFWSYVDIRTPTQCWEWKKGLFQNGYGQFRVGKYKIRTHRLAFYLRRKYLPEDKYICHSCDNPKCCNPSHLFDGTPKQNSQDRDEKGRTGDGGSTMKRLTGMARGINNPAHRLNPYQVNRIKYIYANDGIYTMKKLGKMFGVCTSTIRNIIREKTWHYE